MNSHELLLEVRRLKGIKEKNEKAIPAADLQGKYKKSYDKLREELKQRQCELRTAYVNATRLLAETMAESVYKNTEVENTWLLEVQRNLYKGTGADPLVKELFQAFWDFGEEKL